MEDDMTRFTLLSLTGLAVFGLSSLSAANPSFPRNELGGMASYMNNGNARVQRIQSLALSPVYHYYLSNSLFVGPISAVSWIFDRNFIASFIDLGAEIGYGIPLKTYFPYASLGAKWQSMKTEITSIEHGTLGVPLSLGLKILPGGFIGCDVKAGYTYINPDSKGEYNDHDFSVLIGLIARF
jgi:hypothetical protein